MMVTKAWSLKPPTERDFVFEVLGAFVIVATLLIESVRNALFRQPGNGYLL